MGARGAWTKGLKRDKGPGSRVQGPGLQRKGQRTSPFFCPSPFSLRHSPFSILPFPFSLRHSPYCILHSPCSLPLNIEEKKIHLFFQYPTSSLLSLFYHFDNNLRWARYQRSTNSTIVAFHVQTSDPSEIAKGSRTPSSTSTSTSNFPKTCTSQASCPPRSFSPRIRSRKNTQTFPPSVVSPQQTEP